MDYVKEAAGKWDEVVEAFGVKVFIDPRALLHIVGSTMDFVDDNVRTPPSFSAPINRLRRVPHRSHPRRQVRSEFVFNNPNSKGECGCGESFNV